MNREHLLTGFLILILSSSASSQGHSFAAGETSIQTQRSAKPKADGLEFQKSVDVKLEYQHKGCSATLGLEYYQKGPDAHVKSTLRNEECAASSGSYVIRVRYVQDDGERDSVEFEEAWSRDDDANVVTEKDYYVGNDLDIRRVSSARLKCECTEPQSGEPTPASETSRDKDVD